MKPVDPRSYKNPSGWRYTYSAFIEFRTTAQMLGEPVSHWSLEYPSTFKEKVTGAWVLKYTLFGVLKTVYIGYNSETATAGIREIMKSYPKHQRKQFHTAESPKPKKPPLVTDAGLVQKLFWEWNQVIAKVGHTISEAEYREKYKLHIFMLTRKAGILNMSMRTYLTSHPHSQYWVTPPMSEEQLRNRNLEFSKIVQQKEARALRERNQF